ncbi:MAG: AMP-binding protein [Acidobacteriota bacterium]
MHDTNLLEDQPIAWIPTPEVIERAQLTRFMKQVGISTWNDLYEFSIRDVEKFTEEVLTFLDIKFDPPYGKLLDTSGGIESPVWFAAQAETRPVGSVLLSESGAVATGPAENADCGLRIAESDDSSLVTGHSSLTAGLNITEMCLDRWQTDEMKDQPAVIWENEFGEPNELSYLELFEEVEEVAEGLRLLDLKKGDAIGIHLPMMRETVVALLAVSRMGAIAVPVFSGYGIDAIASRLNAVEAKALFTIEGFQRRGKNFDAFSIAQEAVNVCPSVKSLIVVGRETPTNIAWEPDERALADLRVIFYHLLIERVFDEGADRWFPVRTSAEDPLIILYTSGTTGKPKGIAHTHASFPIKAAQDMAFGTDVGRGTRISWYTDIGWMMGPWLIYGALINGATICIYDGAPDYPTPDRMWEFCAKHKVEVLGISPTLVRALAAHDKTRIQGSVPPAVAGGSDKQEDDLQRGRKDAKEESDSSELPPRPRKRRPPLLNQEGSSGAPHQRHDLSSLRMFASTGEPWNPAPWWWLFEKVGNSKLPIINYSGGTEIAGGILMGNPLLPIKPCSFPAPCPGMDVDILDEEGNPVGPNEVGELVIKQPWIGMARGFWQEKERYLDTYWRRFKDIWVHGDWAMRDKDGHWFILGRSDDTLKVAGKRVGPAEVESILVSHPDVIEAAVIGVPDEAKGTAMVAFCVLSDKGQVTSDQGRGTSEEEHVATSTSSSSSLVTRHSSLERELKALVARDMGKPLAPSKIHFVSALPKTRNAKVMRRVLRSTYLGEDPGDLSALENPRTVTEIQNILRT